MASRKGLGRGIDRLIVDKPMAPAPEAEADATQAPAGITPPAGSAAVVPTSGPSAQMLIPVGSIKRNPQQPRQVFNEAALDELAASIREHGILQPLVVHETGKGMYELIAGERRLRAAGLAGLAQVPVTLIRVSEQSRMEIALIENLQRENLNPLEEAEGYQELASRFDLTQEDIAQRVGRSRAAVANALRLLSLPEEVRAMLGDGRLTTGHAKCLLSLNIPQEQMLLARRVVEEGLSVRTLEKLVKRMNAGVTKPRVASHDLPPNHVRDLSERLHKHFGTSVRLAPCRTFANGKKSKGTIEIDFFSNSDLERVLTLLGLDVDE